MMDLGNIGRFASSGEPAGLSEFERSVCGCGESAKPVLIYLENQWTLVGHDPECRLSVLAKRRKVHILDLDEIGDGVAQVGPDVAQLVGREDGDLGAEIVSFPFDGEADPTIAVCVDGDVAEIKNCHAELLPDDSSGGTVENGASPATGDASDGE